jgi:hypothetical protein
MISIFLSATQQFLPSLLLKCIGLSPLGQTAISVSFHESSGLPLPALPVLMTTVGALFGRKRENASEIQTSCISDASDLAKYVMMSSGESQDLQGSHLTSKSLQ